MRIFGIGDRDVGHLTHRKLDAAFALMPEGIDCAWVATDSHDARDLEASDGVWLLPGSPYRDDAVAYKAIDHCLRAGKPFLGTCAGFQYACVALARSRAGIKHAAHAETDPDAENPVIAPLACSLYGERRLVHPTPGTRLADICGKEPFIGFHWCGYGVNPAVEQSLIEAGVVLSARAVDAGVEAIELPDHRFFMATAFQPQVGSGDSRNLHPLIIAFVQAVEAGAANGATSSAG